MSIVDLYDPSGMFSKAGRISLEMFQMIQQKNDILYGKKKYFQPKHGTLDIFEADSLKEALEKKEKKFNHTIDPSKKIIKQLTKKEPFDSIVSREKIYHMRNREKLNDKRFGMYRPRYNLVFQKSPLYTYENAEEDEKKKMAKKKHEKKKNSSRTVSNSPSRSKSMHKNDLTTERNSQDTLLLSLPDLPIKPPRKVPYPTPLSKQLPRKDIFVTDVNENRFEFIKLPSISTKCHKSYVADLNHGGRSLQFSIFQNSKSGLEYKPKFDLVLKKEGLMVPKFEKIVSRKEQTQNSYTMNESTFIVDEYSLESFSPVKRKIPGPSFEKMIPREKLNNSLSKGTIHNSTQKSYLLEE